MLILPRRRMPLAFFSLNAAAATRIYTLSLHDALPIWVLARDDHVVAAVAIPRGNAVAPPELAGDAPIAFPDRKSTRLNSSHVSISYAVFCLKKKTNTTR